MSSWDEVRIVDELLKHGHVGVEGLLKLDEVRTDETLVRISSYDFIYFDVERVL